MPLKILRWSYNNFSSKLLKKIRKIVLAPKQVQKKKKFNKYLFDL